VRELHRKRAPEGERGPARAFSKRCPLCLILDTGRDPCDSNPDVRTGESWRKGATVAAGENGRADVDLDAGSHRLAF
jgi:hypothetical protein